MFDNIARRYDLLNHVLSLGIDRLWRKKAVNLLKKDKPANILDIATGTGDFAIEAMKIPACTVVGIDISEGMLEKGREKLQANGFASRIELQKGDSEDLKFDTNTFAAITAGFGVRNFENLEKGLSEMHRVLKPTGKVCILEFSKPTAFPIKQIYGFYFKFILPTLGRMVSKDDSAYTYLPESVYEFPDGEAFLKKLNKVGFKNTKQVKLTFGIASLYLGEK
ncbi:bifunctional demethylmenaquinone methyltransferase/2-methoxy-6-polyprenyl-1,4-benzoquinol methylase UbiE [Prolixibacteraceae bacterium JC049]|nr:bifunctional demethylmenaquinone methyltransferase/2-methoxy-6-polyprenyl-1,4-benzoquinol methylase UbiE [Prolixibacteraceae bacterium JC049]